MVHSEAMLAEPPLKESPSDLYVRVFRALRPRTPMPEFEVAFRQFANVNSFIEWKDGRVFVRISDILAGAPPPVQEALAWILLGKALRKRVPSGHAERYKRFLNRRDVVETIEKVRRFRGRKVSLPPAGTHFDLVEVFEGLNTQFFGGLMARPELGWSAKPSRSILGHYDSAHHAIIISRLLDQPDVPRVVVEYVMYHEMLHLRWPVRRRGSRRCVHTPEFQAAEKLFPRLEEARRGIERLCREAQRSK